MELFAHNRTAYDHAIAMMRRTGKAAVIHPTGTGKSFIAFALALDYPNARICWLSPSEYIFKTQLENLANANHGQVPTNILFYTYAKLPLLTHEEINEIQPDYIVLDEFHRCGAKVWGAGVDAVLSRYPDVPILGLSATNIRYLDNQRDMADELFAGNIASQMTLGEAIVRGILTPPKYVLSVFSFQKDMEKYRQRIRRAKSKAVRDEAERYLEALRRALEKADGLDTMFAKHMEDRTGKYIVFCSSKEHMDEMVALAPEWFCQVDRAPHIYCAYSEDPESGRAFSAFKADTDAHLKLLYCIDMLNEGVHVEDVDGVILLRPTVSPIIYKQQIGRALSAGKKKNAVIFDIVLNIENLYSVGAIEEEMQAAALYYRSLGRENEIVNEQFRVIDEVRDCMELFDRLNDSLRASWELMFYYAQRYRDENGDLEVPKRYITPEGYSLGEWLRTQRLVYAGKISGNLTDTQIAMLDSLGMRWESLRDLAWDKYYAAARCYYHEHGNLLVNIMDVPKDGLPLGRWLAQLRSYRKSGIRCAYLTQERIAALDEIGMVWDVPDYLWERNYAAAVTYHRQHGNLEVPADYVDADGIRLGVWIRNIRAGIKKADSRTQLTPQQRERLDALGMNWMGKYNTAWEQSYTAACRYYEEHGNFDIPVAYVTEDGIALGRWIRRQRDASLTPERKEKLESVGILLKKPDRWMEKFMMVKAYYDQHGDTKMPADLVVDGVWIRRWLTEQIARLNEKPTGKNKAVKKLSAEQIASLKSVGIVPEGKPVRNRIGKTTQTEQRSSV